MQQFFLDELYISNVYGDSIPYRRSGQPKWIKCLYLGSKPQSLRKGLNRIYFLYGTHPIMHTHVFLAPIQ